jgi:3-phytase
MRSERALAWLATSVLLAGCATIERVPTPLPAIDVPAQVESDPVGTSRGTDAADDPAIWHNPVSPAQSLIVGTDKRAGLYVYGLDGRRRSFTAAGEVNNVDLRDGVRWQGRDVILVGASNRDSLTQPRLTLYALDPGTAALEPLASLTVPATGEAYGFCFGAHRSGMPLAYIVTKQGQVLELDVNAGGGGAAPSVRLVRSFGVTTQPEGCVVDDRTGQLYLGEEDVGIWRFDLAQAAPVAQPFAMVGAEQGLVADVEGLALAPDGQSGGYLVASSQGDNAYAIFDLESGELRGRFRIQGGSIDGTYDTDGIELILGDFGPAFAGGLFVAQDGDNAPQAQNFKLLSWDAILGALNLR